MTLHSNPLFVVEVLLLRNWEKESITRSDVHTYLLAYTDGDKATSVYVATKRNVQLVQGAGCISVYSVQTKR